MFARQLGWLHSVPKSAGKAAQQGKKTRLAATGGRPPLPPVILGGAYLDAFMDVGPAQPGAAGPVPLTYGELDAWVRLTGRFYAPWEVELFRAMSSAYCDAKGAGEEPGASPPWVAPVQADRADLAKRLRVAFSARAKPGVRTTTENRS